MREDATVTRSSGNETKRGRSGWADTTRAAAVVTIALLVAACSSDGETNGDVDLEANDDVEFEANDGAVKPSSLDDEELAAFLDDLTDEEFDEFTDGLSDDEYDDLIDRLEAADSGDASGDEQQFEDTGEADDADGDGTDDPGQVDERDDVDCSAEGLGADDSFEFTSAHFVVDGRLGAACFREPDERLTLAWDALATIAPAGQLADLGLFGGFEANEDSEEITLAFVNTLDDDGTLFQMSVNLQAFEDDPDEAQLTMAHEFAHVFTQLPSQMDRTDEGIDNCDTYFNGDGCLYEDSILWQWIQLFWGPELIAEVDPTAENTSADGEQRCDDDAGFFGSYGASTPDEDFAEAFSAYVFETGVTSDERKERTDWIAAQPGLAEFRDRAVAAGLTGLPNNFEPCGL